MTDGIQFQLPILTIRPRETNGLSNLFKRGYTGFKEQDEPMINMNTFLLKKLNFSVSLKFSFFNRGIYCLGKDKIMLDKPDLKDYMFLGVDPGRKKPMSVSIISGQDIPTDWNERQREITINKSMDENKHITNKEYYNLCGMTENHEFELKRRNKNKDYNNSIRNLSKYDSKNNFSTRYTQEKIKYWNVERKEKFTKYRLKRKFKTFSSTQSGLAKCCKNITLDFKKQCKAKNCS